jgi:hypothetical protein
MEQTVQDRRTEFLERKKRFFESDPDAIVIAPVRGDAGRELPVQIDRLSRAMNTLRRRAGLSADPLVVAQKLKDLKDFVDKVWEEVKKFVPRLFAFNPERWRDLDDSIEQKRILLQRMSSIVIRPRGDMSIAKLAIAVKTLNVRILELQSMMAQTDGVYEELSKISTYYRELLDRVTDFVTNIEKEAGITKPSKKGNTE